MIDAAKAAMRFASGRDREDLDKDEMFFFALVRAIEIIGEAASKVSAETRVANAAIPWFAAISMRNRLIHAYFDIDRDILWKTVIEEIPPLLSLLRSVST